MDRKKIVIRKLPPNVAEEDVKQAVQEASKGAHSWFSFVQGKTSVRKTVHSRCYVCLDDPAAIPAFKAAVEKHVYVTDRGAQYRGVVEFAPYQGVPEGKVKRDPREGTLHDGFVRYWAFVEHVNAVLQPRSKPEVPPGGDPEYLAFVERLHAEPQPESKVEAPQAPRQGQEKPVTALMAFLQAKHVRKKQGPAVVARPRKESRARPVHTAVMDADADNPDDYDRSGALLAASALAQPAKEPDRAVPLAPGKQRIRSKREAAGGQGKDSKPGVAKESSSRAEAVSKERERDAKPERIKAGFQIYQPGQRPRQSSQPAENQGAPPTETGTQRGGSAQAKPSQDKR